MTHGRDCPDRCSICQGARPRTVTIRDGLVLVDGRVESRLGDGDIPAQMTEARQRGGAATARTRGRR